jgi:peptidoglycan hydrolase-like amidase
MKHIIFILIISLVFFLTGSAQAENTIKVLMLETPYDPLPSENARKINSISGRVLLNSRYYDGDLNILSDEKGVHVVKILPFDQYIEGVVASESGNDWELEALKAQAIVSRTYAIFF